MLEVYFDLVELVLAVSPDSVIVFIDPSEYVIVTVTEPSVFVVDFSLIITFAPEEVLDNLSAFGVLEVGVIEFNLIHRTRPLRHREASGV